MKAKKSPSKRTLKFVVVMNKGYGAKLKGDQNPLRGQETQGPGKGRFDPIWEAHSGAIAQAIRHKIQVDRYGGNGLDHSRVRDISSANIYSASGSDEQGVVGSHPRY